MTRLAADLRIARDRRLAAIDIAAGGEGNRLGVAQVIFAFAPGFALLLFARAAVLRFGAGLLRMAGLWDAPWKATKFAHKGLS